MLFVTTSGRWSTRSKRTECRLVANHSRLKAVDSSPEAERTREKRDFFSAIGEALAQVLAISPAQIVELTRLGVLRPVERDVVSSGTPHRYEFLESLRAYLRHLRNQHSN